MVSWVTDSITIVLKESPSTKQLNTSFVAKMTVSSFMTVLVFVSCVLVTFLTNPISTCPSDGHCSANPLCIEGNCYNKKEYNQSCVFDRQCFQLNQRCFERFCDCKALYYWKNNRCLENNKCDFNRDCDRTYDYCNLNTRTCFTRISFGWYDVSFLTFGILTAIIITVRVGRRVQRARQKRSQM